MAVSHSDTLGAYTDNPSTGVSKTDWTADHIGLGQWMYKSTGRYMSQKPNGTSGSAPTLNRLNYLPWLVPAGTIDRLGVWITAGGSAGSVVRLGLYSPSTTTGLPETRLVDGGTVDTTGTGFVEVTVNTTVTAGLIWFAAVGQVAVPTWVITNETTWWVSESTPTNNLVYGFHEASISGALPATAGSLSLQTGAGNVPRFWIRYSA